MIRRTSRLDKAVRAWFESREGDPFFLVSEEHQALANELEAALRDAGFPSEDDETRKVVDRWERTDEEVAELVSAARGAVSVIRESSRNIDIIVKKSLIDALAPWKRRNPA